jgi:hypothetical protein
MPAEKIRGAQLATSLILRMREAFRFLRQKNSDYRRRKACFELVLRMKVVSVSSRPTSKAAARLTSSLSEGQRAT